MIAIVVLFLIKIYHLALLLRGLDFIIVKMFVNKVSVMRSVYKDPFSLPKEILTFLFCFWRG